MLLEQVALPPGICNAYIGKATECPRALLSLMAVCDLPDLRSAWTDQKE
jgi:hypothetical protein